MTSTPSPHKPRRKKIFFLRGFQLRFAFLVAGSLLVLLLFAGLHGLFVAELLLPAELSSMARPYFVASTWRLFGVGMLYIGVVTTAAVFLAHREVGPVARLESEIRRLSDASPGENGILHVREGDGLEGLVDAINQAIHKGKGRKV